MDLHAIIPVVRDADAAAAGRPALVALPQGVAYVRAPKVDPYSGSLDLATTPLAPTDAVVDVFGLDRKLFDAANDAKRRVHLCVGGAGTLAAARSPCVDPTPTVFPWVLCFPAFCPCALCNALCAPHEDMDWPPWAAHALVVTENGVVGRRNMRPDGHVIRLGELRHHERDVNAIAWDGFDVDNIEVRSYAEEDKTCYWNCEEPPGHPDPLSYALGFGLLAPCCWKVLCNPTTPGLYRAKIKSDHTTTVSSGDSSATYNTAQISLIALARSPEDLLESLRAAKAKYEAPAAAAMDRSHPPPPATSGDSGPKVNVRVGCSVM